MVLDYKCNLEHNNHKIFKMESKEYFIILFQSVNYAMKAEKVLKEKNISFKLIPVPKNISSDCGVCIRFLAKDREKVLSALKNNVEFKEIIKL